MAAKRVKSVKKSTDRTIYAEKMNTEPLLKRFNDTVSAAEKCGISTKELFEYFKNAVNKNAASFGSTIENMPSIQNRRIKGISPLPKDVSKEDIGKALQSPYQSEKLLAGVSTALKFSAYPYYKITKTYGDIPTYHHYTAPLYIDKEDAGKEDFIREYRLLDKFCKTLSVESAAHKITGQAVTYGKVFYYPRYQIDKAHNKVNYAFLQQLPQGWTTIIGQNNISGYTVSFDMMYFVQPGTNPYSFGDLFKPYIEDFERLFVEPTAKKAVYAQKIQTPDGMRTVYPDNVNPYALGRPKFFEQNGRWAYYVTLPVDQVWTFEIDDTTPAVIYPLSGLMMTDAQQSDYENAQLSLLLNPLVKIFTGEVPFFKEENTTAEDGWRLSAPAREMFSLIFDELMYSHNTGGSALYMAPLQNIKSHDFAESANANEISTSFNRYGLEKAGLSGILPSTSDPKAGLAEMSAKLESRYSNCIYRQFEKMMNYFYSAFNLNYEWNFRMFGSIYTDEKTREAAEKELANGDISAYYVLSALDGQSYLDKLAMMQTVKKSGLLEMLTPPQTSYTQSASSSKEVGRPSASAEGAAEGTEKTIDTRGSI